MAEGRLAPLAMVSVTRKTSILTSGTMLEMVPTARAPP
jgi:hypothetical protein